MKPGGKAKLGIRARLASIFKSTGLKLQAVFESLALGFLTAEEMSLAGLRGFTYMPEMCPAKLTFNSEIRLDGIVDWRGAKVLDLGCGQGREAFFLEERGADVLGIDKNQFMLARAEEFGKDLNSGVTFAQVDYLLEDLPEGPFDIVYFPSGMYCSVLGRRRRRNLLERLCSVLKEDGTLILTVRPYRLDGFAWQVRHFLTRLSATLSGNPFPFERGDQFVLWEPCHAFSEIELAREIESSALRVTREVWPDPGGNIIFVLCEKNRVRPIG